MLIELVPFERLRAWLDAGWILNLVLSISVLPRGKAIVTRAFPPDTDVEVLIAAGRERP